MSRDSLGHIEQFVLIALLRFDGESYGVPIMREIQERTRTDVSRAAIYIALRRLEAKGLVTSAVGAATAERGGRAKRMFAITKAGARQLRASREASVRMWADADALVRKAAR